MSKREVAAVSGVLSDPAMEGKPTEKVIEAAIAALDDVRAKAGLPVAVGKILTDQTRPPQEAARAAFEEMERIRRERHRLAVVGQIQYGPQGETHTVVLGPFGATGVPDTHEKFLKALEHPCTDAREAGRGLAWDPKTRGHRGRFMLAPVFWSPRDAWDFYRPVEEVPEIIQKISEDVAQWQPGLWGEEMTAKGLGGPVCSCGLRGEPLCRFCGGEVIKHCPRHEKGAVLHECHKAA